MDEGLLTLTGTVESVIYQNASNGYIVFEIDASGSLVSVVGYLGEVGAGEKVSLSGEYITSPKYGKQFKAQSCERMPPETTDEIKRYLGSGIIRGLGPSLAKKIGDHFGEDSLYIIESEPHRLEEVSGVTSDRAAYIHTEYKRICSVKTIISFLGEFGLSPQTAVAVWQRYDNSSVEEIKKNPYILCEFGIDVPFETADRLAHHYNIDSCDHNRVQAAISHILLKNAQNGHTCVPMEQLQRIVCEDYEVGRDPFDITLDDGIEAGVFGILTAGKRSRIYLAPYHQAEMYISTKLAEMLKLSAASQTDFSEEIGGIEWAEGISYETLQKAAINGCMGNNLFILTGGPGTGKTTTLNAVIQLLKAKKHSLALAAPTGRAAKRMSDLTGEEAKTIHRLLEVEMTAEGQISFKRNELNPLKKDVVIIDEMSMVDVLLFESLLRAVKPDCKLIMVGDANQLPSVGAGNVLRDLIAAEIIPTVELKEIFRQAAESLIVTNAHKIVAGKMPEMDVRDKDFFFMERGSDEEIARLVIDLNKRRLPDTYKISPFDDIQVLSPTKMGAAGTRELNRHLQMALNPRSMKKREIKFYDIIYREGDKVMQITNDYDVNWKKNGEKGMGIFNGDIGIIVEIDPHSGNLLINFEGRAASYTSTMLNKIEHAYAITIHKSQGSEYNAVIMPITDRSQMLLYRNLLYTGVTRAKNILILIGRRDTVQQMVDSDRRTLRYSNIKPLLIAKYRKTQTDEQIFD